MTTIISKHNSRILDEERSVNRQQNMQLSQQKQMLVKQKMFTPKNFIRGINYVQPTKLSRQSLFVALRKIHLNNVMLTNSNLPMTDTIKKTELSKEFLAKMKRESLIFNLQIKKYQLRLNEKLEIVSHT